MSILTSSVFLQDIITNSADDFGLHIIQSAVIFSTEEVGGGRGGCQRTKKNLVYLGSNPDSDKSDTEVFQSLSNHNRFEKNLVYQWEMKERWILQHRLTLKAMVLLEGKFANLNPMVFKPKRLNIYINQLEWLNYFTNLH